MAGALSGLGVCVILLSLAGDVPTSGVQSPLRQSPGELPGSGSPGVLSRGQSGWSRTW